MTHKKFLVIGYGNMGKLHVSIIKTLVPEAIFDIIDEKKFNFKDKCLSQILLEEIKNINSYYGIIISSHSDSHLRYFKNFKDFKKLIFIEKPIVNSSSEFNELVSYNHKNIFCGFIETHNELFKIAKDNLTTDPFLIQVERISSQVEPERVKDDVGFDLTIHDLSVALEYFIDFNSIISFQSLNKNKNSQGFFELNNSKIETNELLANFTSSRLGQKKIRIWKIFSQKEEIQIDLINKEINIIRQSRAGSLEKNQLTQNNSLKTINAPEVNPAKIQMEKYLELLESGSTEYNFEKLLKVHELLLKDN